jgi:hypothetical protein
MSETEHEPAIDNPRPNGAEPPRRPASVADFARAVLDPRSLNVLMAAGGGLLALGLVIWLTVIGVFDNPVVAAIALGSANVGLLGLGAWLAACTRYRGAGRGFAMLACALLPLNLWFYDAQGLITLAEGGNLWIPAVGCCLLYVAVARVLRDPLFVYSIVGGLALAGLLFLADGDVGRFWEVIAPSTLLVSLGVACIHAERLFPQATDGASFSRENFGLAFFRAGHASMAAGLMVLLAGTLAGRFYDAVFEGRDWFAVPDLMTVLSVKLSAIGLMSVAGYSYVYSRLSRGGERFTLMAVLTLGWATWTVLELLGVGSAGALLTTTAVGCACIVGGLAIGQAGVSNAGRIAVALGAGSGALLAANRLVGGDADSWLALYTVGQALVAGFAAALTGKDEGRRALVAVTIVAALASVFVIGSVSELSHAQHVELFATAAGLAFIVAGLVGWRQETLSTGQQNGLVDLHLWVGSLLATVPITIGLLGTRLSIGPAWWEATHEIGVLAIGLTLVGVGALARLRATTLCGVGALAVYLLSLVTLIDLPDQLQSVAFYMIAGGGALFGGAVLLSVYRDRLLALPEKVSRGEGVFAVLKWR